MPSITTTTSQKVRDFEPKRRNRRPCQSINNCNEYEPLPTHQRRVSRALKENGEAFINHFGLNKVAFLTLTFRNGKQITSREAQRCFRSFRTGFLKKYLPDYIAVLAVGEGGSIHFHLLVNCQQDIRTGFDFNAYPEGDRTSACPHLRHLWKLLESKAPKYGFGYINELLPIESNVKAMANYPRENYEETVHQRHRLHKGARLVSYSQGTWRVWHTKFGLCTPEARVQRRKIGAFAAAIGASDFKDITKRLGSGWAIVIYPALYDTKLCHVPKFARDILDPRSQWHEFSYLCKRPLRRKAPTAKPRSLLERVFAEFCEE